MGIRYVGRLRSFLRTPRTIQRYQRAVGQFAVWARTKGIRVRTAAEADAALQLYFDQLFDEGSGRGRSVAAAVLSGVQVAQPAWRGQLHGAQESLAGWAKKVPTESYPPLVHHLAVACAVWLAHQGRWRAGAAVLVAFEGLLRVTEMASMNVGDVLLPEDSRVGDGDVKGATLCLPRTKTGRNQSVDITNSSAVQCLRLLMRGRSKGRPLVGLSGLQLLRAVKDACAGLGLGGAYVWHSLRHGKATSLRLQGVPVAEIQLLGRWRDSKSVLIYMQTLKARLLQQRIPRVLGAAARKMALDPWRWFSAAMRTAAKRAGTA